MKAKDVIIGLLFLAAIVLVFVVIFSMPSGALSDETKEIVNNLRWKHYGHGDLSDITWGICETDRTFVWNPDWETIMFDDETGILYCETPKGKWYIKMKEVKE